MEAGALVEAAKKMRMNTASRRAVFYAVMASGDWMEAAGKLAQLKYKVGGRAGLRPAGLGHVLKGPAAA